MIKFKNVAGDSFLAVGTIQRKFALNGEKSLSGVLYDGDNVLNNIDKGWSLEFDGEPYVVSYFERNDSDNTLSFDAVHKFFWVMSKSVLYSETSGSHTIKWYLDQIFANIGYSYALNFNPNAIAKDNWGMKTKLSLFNDIISSINGEFEINGTLISIFEKVGSDLSTIVRYGFNLSDMSIENDAAGFVTYGEGFGAYEDQQNQSGPRLHATYTSPLASVYGILQAEPVDDQRYTSESSIVGAIKAKVDGSFSVSIKLSLYDLTSAGYPYKMAHVGDWLMAIDEKLDFKQHIRIISIDDEFDANGNRISYTVTAGNIGVVQKYQEANASLSSQVSNALDTASKASDDANIALISANGKNTSYYVDSVDALPAKANEGDMGWVQSGDGRVLYIYKKKPDGTFYWEKRIDPEMGEQIAAGVNKAVTDAKTYSDQLVATNREQVDAVLDDVKAKQADLTAQQAELDTKAQRYANKALADAKADTLATATQTAKDASDALAKAKTDLTTSLNKEVTDRANAVTALDTKAKGYADTAKADAISASTTADGVINKKIDDTASSITSTISQNKTDADGKITTAQSTATQALNGLATKVSQTVYDAKTGQLQTDLNTTTTTANQAKTDIVTIKSDNTKQDARMTTIESDANGTKTTVSNLQTDLGKANGSISTLQQRADGFDATVTKVNNLSIGGRNLYLNSRVLADGYGTNGSVTVTVEPFDSTTNMWHIVAAQSTDKVVGIYIFDYGKGKITDNSDWSYSADIKGTGKVIQFGIEDSTKSPVKGNIGSKWSRTSQTGHVNEPPYKTIIMYFDTMDSPLDVYIKLPKLETGNLPTDWTPAPEDVDSATAKAQLTADKASLDLSKYQTDADGRISKAQADIIVNANAITQKVSQSDYNAKTGDLTTKVNTAQSTADSATSTIGAYKTANDARVASAESNITANATAITSKVSQSDYNTKTGQIDGQISTINQTAGKISQTVSDVKAQVDGLSVGGRNLYLNSRAVADNYGGAGTITVEPFDSTTNMWHVVSPQGQGFVGIYLWDYGNGKIPDNSDWAFSADVKGTSTPSAFGIELGGHNPVVGTVGSDWARISQTGRVDSGTRKTLTMYFDSNIGPVDVYIKLPKLALGNLTTDWSPAPEDIDNKISTVSQTVDSISSIVSDPTTGLTKRIQTAEGSISTVQSNVSDLQSKQTQTANGLTTEISNRATGDTNTLTQAKDFTTSSISNSESGMRSLITQTSDSIIAKVDTKTDSATVLSLLKDNWSIGITGNTNKLASGIAADSSAMAIVSQKVIIDSPQTQITGTAWINSAMIGNGQIGNAQIGDAAITSAKIADLDVSKITGNVTNFIQSNWNGEYSSTKITSTGMEIGDLIKNGFDTTFDKTGMTFKTTDARYGYAMAHYGTDTIKGKGGGIAGRGMEIRIGTENGVGFDYFAIKSPGANNLEFGNTTNAGHMSIVVVPDTNLMPIFNKGVTILDDLYVGKVNGARAGSLLSGLVGQTIYIPTSMNSNGTVGKWQTVTL